MKFSDFETIAKHLAEPIRKYVSDAIKPFKKHLDDLSSKVDSIKKLDADDIALQAAELIEKPNDGVNGIDGKDGLNGKSFIEQLPDLGFESKEHFIESLNGKNGKDGTNGLDGKDGKNGIDGINGKSAYELALDYGFSGDINQWLESLKGDDGLNGLDGKDGLNGKDGRDGDNGLDGKDGINGKSFTEQLPELGFDSFDEFQKSLKGADGKDGLNGVNGLDGTNGKDGRNGLDGKNALDLDILPIIDEQRSYERNSYATHDGGLWRSHSNTKGLRGWECIIDGIKDIDISQIDERNFKVTINRSSGESIEKSFTMPTMIYKGVYKEGNQYQKGDTVTWGGSIWHCNQDTTAKPDSLEQKHWTLAAKRGRDGK